MFFWLILIEFFCVDCFYLKLDTDYENKTAVEEVQNAICSISTKEFEASANATISRQLKGVCTSAALKSMLNDLEKRMMDGFSELKQILQDNGFKVPNLRESVVNEVTQIELKQIHTNPGISENRVSLDDEIFLKNDTLDPSSNLYFYFWKVDNIRSLLQKSDMYHSSPEFSIMGHILYLQLFPNYPETRFLSLQLGRRNNSFLKKHKMYILNQSDLTKSLESTLLYSLKGRSMFIIAENVLEEYILDNAIIVKLEIYLNSYFLVFFFIL
nr:unnamed protein product [Callosobruchus chinensis]